jgi:pilus assembly protein CpaB
LNRRALLLVITGGVAAIAAALVIYFLITNIPQPQTIQPTDNTPVARRVVLIAATDIAANTQISEAQVTTGTFPIDMVPPDALTSTDDVLTATVRSRIFAGQILLQRQFIIGVGEGSSVNVPVGKVMVAFPSTDMLNATGAVQQGDHVDIMLSIPISGTSRLNSGSDTGTQLATVGERTLVAQSTLQNIEVYNVGQWAPPGQQVENAADTGLKIISFIVEPQEALILKYVKDSGGTIDLAVRSAEDTQIFDTDPVTLDYLVDVFEFIGLTPPGQAGQAAPAPAPAP